MRPTFQKILCATDLTEVSNQALPYAVALARQLSARLFVCHAIDFAPAGMYDVGLLVLPARSKEVMEDVRTRIKELMTDSTVAWEPLVVEGEAALAISEAAEARGVDLIVAATHGRSGLSRALLGSVTQRLLHSAHGSVLTVRVQEGMEPAMHEGWSIRKILVGCDFSSDSGLALDHGIGLAQAFGSELHLIHVLEPTIYHHLDAAAGALASELERSVEKTVRQKLESLVPATGQASLAVKTAFASGHPYEEIPRFARANNIDLIVVGRRGHGLIDRMLVGSTSDRVIRLANCPVLTVEVPGKAEV